MNAMKERPILFTGPMVRAILEDRKTQTRRPVKPQPDLHNPPIPGTYADLYNHGPEWAFWLPDNRMTEPRTWRCPYGAPSDRLWVRETWFEEYDPITAKPYDPPRACYQATHDGEVRKMDGDGGTVFRRDGTEASPWRPGIHMPRWASRLLLEVEEIRVERVQAITEEDAAREGFAASVDETWTAYDPACQGYPTFFVEPPSPPYESVRHHRREVPARKHFATAWSHMHGGTEHAWHVNPWVWVVTFRRVEAARSAA